VYGPNVSFVFRLMLYSSVFMLQVFRVSKICFKTHGVTAQALGKGMASQGPTDGAHGTRVLRTGRTHPHPGFPGPSCAERGGGQGKGVAGAGGVRVWGKARQKGARYACGAERSRRGTDVCVQQREGPNCSGHPGESHDLSFPFVIRPNRHHSPRSRSPSYPTLSWGVGHKRRVSN
jgi:hypothetical protein